MVDLFAGTEQLMRNLHNEIAKETLFIQFKALFELSNKMFVQNIFRHLNRFFHKLFNSKSYFCET